MSFITTWQYLIFMWHSNLGYIQFPSLSSSDNFDHLRMCSANRNLRICIKILTRHPTQFLSKILF